jgi:hypothetical protein
MGNIDFIIFDNRTWNHIHDNDSFVLEGIEERHKLTLVATGCKAIKYSSLTEFTNSSVHESATFAAFKLNTKYRNSDTVEICKLIIEFGIMNVYKVPYGTPANTQLGVLQLFNYDDIKERQDLTSVYHMPLITSNITLTIDRNTEINSSDKLVDEAIKIVDDFLKITSLFQTTWHEWTFVIANAVGYDNINKLLRRLSIRMITPKSKPSHFRQIVNSFSFGTHVNEAWERHTHQINESYGYDYALDIILIILLAGHGSSRQMCFVYRLPFLAYHFLYYATNRQSVKNSLATNTILTYFPKYVNITYL